MIGVLIESDETSTLTLASPELFARASTLYSSVWRAVKLSYGANVTVCPETVPFVGPEADNGVNSAGKRTVTSTFLSASEPWFTTVILYLVSSPMQIGSAVSVIQTLSAGRPFQRVVASAQASQFWQLVT